MCAVIDVTYTTIQYVSREYILYIVHVDIYFPNTKYTVISSLVCMITGEFETSKGEAQRALYHLIYILVG